MLLSPSLRHRQARDFQPGPKTAGAPTVLCHCAVVSNAWNGSPSCAVPTVLYGIKFRSSEIIQRSNTVPEPVLHSSSVPDIGTVSYRSASPPSSGTVKEMLEFPRGIEAVRLSEPCAQERVESYHSRRGSVFPMRCNRAIALLHL